MKVIDYINENFGIGKRLKFHQFEIHCTDYFHRKNQQNFKAYYGNLSIKLDAQQDLDELLNAWNSKICELPEWFKKNTKCQKDDCLPYVEYFDDFIPCLEKAKLNLAFVRGMRDFVDAYFPLKNDAKFCDIALFLNDFTKFDLLVDTPSLNAYDEDGMLRAMIEEKFNDDYISFIDFKESACALVAYKNSLFLDLQCGFDLDNLYDIYYSDYSGVEGYRFDNDFCLNSDVEFENCYLHNISKRKHLPSKIGFRYDGEKRFNIVKFSKAVLCNLPLLEWIEAGVNSFDDYLLEFDGNEVFLSKENEKIKLNENTKWCDVVKINVLIDETNKYHTRLKLFKTVRIKILSNFLIRLENKLKTARKNDIKHLERQIKEVKEELKTLNEISIN